MIIERVQKQLTKFVDQRLHFGDQVVCSLRVVWFSSLHLSDFQNQVDMGNSVFTIELGPVEEAPLASEV